MRDEVGVVQMEQSPVVHRLREVQRPSAVGKKLNIRRLQAAVRMETHPVAGEKRVTFPGAFHVVITVQLHGHRAAGAVRRQGAKRSPRIGLGFFSPESAAHPGRLDHHPVLRPAEDLRDDHLGLARVLRRGENKNPVAIRLGKGGLAFQIKMFLSTDVEIPLDHPGCTAQGLINRPAPEGVGIGVERLFF